MNRRWVVGVVLVVAVGLWFLRKEAAEPERSASTRSLAGFVVARDGSPLAEVRVAPFLVTATSGSVSTWETGEPQTTDARGRFEFTHFPRECAMLHVSGDGVVLRSFGLEGAQEGDELRIPVARLCPFRVELVAAAGPAFERVSALDADGNALSLYSFRRDHWSAYGSGTVAFLPEPGAHPLAVSEDARTLVFWHGEDELARVPLALVPGGLAVLRAPGD
ncbi:MAG: hypothetical protein EXS08_02225 [Planctomycetes bacterium]|nr:hypothetical protein [Planctomycetota bacterium]